MRGYIFFKGISKFLKKYINLDNTTTIVSTTTRQIIIGKNY
jgi:hypothetical protein